MSEDEFENEKEDRFVYLDREFNMICSYNYKFKKWVPLKLADKIYENCIFRKALKFH